MMLLDVQLLTQFDAIVILDLLLTYAHNELNL